MVDAIFPCIKKINTTANPVAVLIVATSNSRKCHRFRTRFHSKPNERATSPGTWLYTPSCWLYFSNTTPGEPPTCGRNILHEVTCINPQQPRSKYHTCDTWKHHKSHTRFFFSIYIYICIIQYIARNVVFYCLLVKENNANFSRQLLLLFCGRFERSRVQASCRAPNSIYQTH